MRLGPLLAATALLLAGCSGSPGDPAGQSSVTTITDPNDTSYLQNGTDQGFHLHDYWGGQDRLMVVDQRANVGFLLNGGDYGVYKFFPDEQAVLPQGTASVDVEVSWTDTLPGLYGDMELWVKTQADAQPEFAAVLTSGTPVTFETVLADADLPHQLLSAWEFVLRIRSPDGQPGNPATGQLRSYNFQATITAEAVRGLELPLFPPHPDHWKNATELPLIEEAGGDTLLWGSEPPNCGFCSGGIAVLSPDSGNLVPSDAAVVEVRMEYTHDTPTGLRLLYHGADTRSWADAPVESDDGVVRVHLIPVEGNGDGPYAAQSLWEFYFGFEGGPSQDGPYSGSWTLTSRVLKELPA